jgi:hypothetical protein
MCKEISPSERFAFECISRVTYKKCVDTLISNDATSADIRLLPLPLHLLHFHLPPLLRLRLMEDMILEQTV